MIKVFNKLSDICFSELMCVYEEGNAVNAEIKYADFDRNAAILLAEQDFYAYLEEAFFDSEDARYYVIIENGKYVSALRVEPFIDGYLLEGLETRPDFRRRGFAKTLINELLNEKQIIIYSHVLKSNEASLATHFSCGFEVLLDSAEFIDGSHSDKHFTLVKKI